MRHLYLKRQRALACFAIAYHCVLGQSIEDHRLWLQNQDRSGLLSAHGPNSLRNGETIRIELDEAPSSLFVIAYQERGELVTQEVAIPAGSEDLCYVVSTVYDGNRQLYLELKQMPEGVGSP